MGMLLLTEKKCVILLCLRLIYRLCRSELLVYNKETSEMLFTGCDGCYLYLVIIAAVFCAFKPQMNEPCQRRTKLFGIMKQHILP